MLQSYLMLSLEVLYKDWFQRLPKLNPNQDHGCLLCHNLCVCRVLDFEFNLKSFKRLNMGMWLLRVSTSVITWPKRPEQFTLSSVVWVLGSKEFSGVNIIKQYFCGYFDISTNSTRLGYLTSQCILTWDKNIMLNWLDLPSWRLLQRPIKAARLGGCSATRFWDCHTKKEN